MSETRKSRGSQDIPKPDHSWSDLQKIAGGCPEIGHNDCPVEPGSIAGPRCSTVFRIALCIRRGTVHKCDIRLPCNIRLPAQNLWILERAPYRTPQNHVAGSCFGVHRRPNPVSTTGALKVSQNHHTKCGLYNISPLVSHEIPSGNLT